MQINEQSLWIRIVGNGDVTLGAKPWWKVNRWFQGRRGVIRKRIGELESFLTTSEARDNLRSRRLGFGLKIILSLFCGKYDLRPPAITIRDSFFFHLHSRSHSGSLDPILGVIFLSSQLGDDFSSLITQSNGAIEIDVIVFSVSISTLRGRGAGTGLESIGLRNAIGRRGEINTAFSQGRAPNRRDAVKWIISYRVAKVLKMDTDLMSYLGGQIIQIQ